MADGDTVIRRLDSADEMHDAVTLFSQVWGAATPLVGVELLQAIAHSGGYVVGAFDGDRLIGASFGFLGRHAGAESLHSHVTGILPGVQLGGVGRQIKNHQREWAAERNIGWITWTFDPLVRRNAWFNIEVLGAHVASYLRDFYGTLDDAINAGDETDRLLVAWPTDAAADRPSGPAGAATIRVATPDDIVRLRRTDPGDAHDWRLRVRDELGGALDAGGVVTGFTRDGEYLVARAG
jgi:predicted GNAT superfamily acetyltransferase